MALIWLSESECVAWVREGRGEMTRSEYQDLVEFIAPQFDRMNRRYTAADKRFDAIDDRFAGVDKRFDAIDDRLRRVEILGEDTRHQVQILAEAVSNTVSKDTFEAFRAEMAAGFEDLRHLLRTSHLDLDRRVTRLEEGPRG